MSGVKIVGDIVKDLLGRVVREGKGRSPVEKAVEGVIEIRERRDKVVKGGKDGSNVGNKGGKGKLLVREGKFEEKGHEERRCVLFVIGHSLGQLGIWFHGLSTLGN